MAFLNSLIASSSQPRSPSSMPRGVCSSDRAGLSCPLVSRPMRPQITRKERPGLPSGPAPQSPVEALYLPNVLRFLLDFTVAFRAVLLAWLPARLSVVPLKSSRMSRPNTVTTPIAATATRATMIRYSLRPCPDSDETSFRAHRPMRPPFPVGIRYTRPGGGPIGRRSDGSTSGGAPAVANNHAVRARKMEQVCEELARTVGAAPDSCVIA